MAKKREQYKMKHYKFKNLIDKGDYLEFSPVEKVQSSSENILFNTIGRISKNEKSELESVFLLNASSIKEKNEDDRELYERIMREGVWINGVRFIRFGKSSSMTMNQRTLFVKESMHDELKEYISLGKIPKETIVSKYETALGLSLSSLNLVEGLPKIAIVPDFERTVIEDVKTVDKYIPTEEDKQSEEYINHLELDKFEEEYSEKSKKLSELFTSDYLQKNFDKSESKDHKSKSGWNREMLQVKLDELEKPVGYKVFNDKVYPVYAVNQTEKEDVTVNKFNLGYEVNVRENHKNTIEPFDGMALVSFEYAAKLDEKLQLKHKANGYQIRMAYVKGLGVRFDTKKWFEENGVTHIEDIWGDSIPVHDLDIILTESCFKAKMNIVDGKKKNLFKNLDEYITLLEEYGHNYIGVTDAIKSADKSDIYTNLNYQFINSLNLSAKNLKKLADKPAKMYAKIMKYADVASVKAFLNMIVRENGESLLDVDVKKAIDLNAAMVFDPRVKSFITRQIKQKAEELAFGNIPINADYKYVTGDCLALIEHISKKEVNGFLAYNEQFCKGKTGEHVMMRNPLTSWHEVHKTNFVDNNNEYIQHLDNVIQINSYDLTMPKCSGMDVDGDKVLLTSEELIRQAVIDDLVIVNDDDKTTTPSKPYNMENIIDFELRNLDNKTPRVTNINTLIQSYALEKGDLRSKELEIATCKQLQAEFIDSVKKGTDPQIPPVLLKKYTRFKPYFQGYIYEDSRNQFDEKRYRKIKSPLNQFCIYAAEKLIKKASRKSYSNPEENSLYNVDTFSLVRDLSKVNFDEGVLIKLANQIKPVYEWFADEKQRIWNKQKGINTVKPSEEERELLELLDQEWKKLYKETRERLNEICDNPSVLTSACLTLEYSLNKDSYIFGWIATEDAAGVLENIKSREDLVKIDVVSVPQLDRLEKEFDGMVLTVENGVGYFPNYEESLSVDLPDGKYPIIEQMGYHFAQFENNRESFAAVNESEEMDTVSELKPLDNYKATLVGLGDKDIANDVVVQLKKEDRYLNVYAGDERIAGISKNNRYDLENEIALDSYCDQPLNLEVKKVNDKSIDVLLSNIS